MSQATQQNTEDTIDLKELFFSLIEQWKVIIISTLITVVCALVYLSITTEQYQTDALVQIKSNKSSPLAGLSSDMLAMASFAGIGGGLGGGSSIQSEIELLKSRAIFGQAIQKLHLDLQIQPELGVFNKLFTSSKYIKQYTASGVYLTNNQQSLFITQFDVPKTYENKNLSLVIKQNQYEIYDQKTDKRLVQGKLNQALQQNDWKIDIKGQIQQEQKFILQKSSLPAAMSNILKSFNAQEKGKGTGILELTYQGENKANIPDILNAVLNIYKQQDIARSVTDKDQQVRFLEKQLPELKDDLNASERQFNQFREKYGTIDVKEESELYLKQSMQLETSKIELQQKQAELGAQYTAEHPAMSAINAQLATINSKINELNGKVKQLPELQRQYLQYYRDVEIKTQLYTSLLGTYQSLNVAKAGELGKVSIIDYAVEPVKPIKPRKLIILVLSIFVGGFIGILLALLRNMLDSGVRNLSQIADEYKLKEFGEIQEFPALNQRSKQYVHPLAALTPSAPPVEQFRQISSAIENSYKTKKNAIVQLVGVSKNVGTSTTVANLAVVFAQMNLKVLLIDTDLRHGQLKEYFNINIQQGLSEYLQGKTSLDAIITPTQQSGLDLIPSGQYSDNPAAVLSKIEMRQLFDQISSKYDLILVDSAPVIDVMDSQICAKYVGVNVLVTRYNYSSTTEIEKALQQFGNAGHSFDGIIFNAVAKKAIRF